MASNVSVLNGQLRYAAASGETNVVTVTQAGDTFTVTDSVELTAIGPDCTSVSPESATCTGASSIQVYVSDGDDAVVVAGTPRPPKSSGASETTC